MSLTVLFILCGWYKFDALTQLDKVQGVMSLELKKDYLTSYVSLSSIIWLLSLSAFIQLGLIVTKLASDEAKRLRREAVSAVARRLRYLGSHKEVMVQDDLSPLESLDKLIRLYHPLRKEPMPNAGPFHVFLRWHTTSSLPLPPARPTAAHRSPTTPWQWACKVAPLRLAM